MKHVYLKTMMCCLLALKSVSAVSFVVGNFEYASINGDFNPSAGAKLRGFKPGSYSLSSPRAIVIPSSVVRTSDNTTWKVKIIEHSAFNPDYSYHGCEYINGVTIPNGIIEIQYHAFANLPLLTSIMIPSSVTTIGKGAFASSGLEEIIVNEGNSTYDSRNNCNAIIETNTNKLISGCKNTIIPNTVTSIEQWAFENCSGLTTITIPSSVTSIDQYAFAFCI